MCGGTTHITAAPLRTTGLSPRVRGNHSRQPLGKRQEGSIPACAGEPSTGCFRADNHRVYPRVCGGTVNSGRINLRRQRSIPACAGEPAPPRPSPIDAPVYPRVCGGTDSGGGGAFACPGLSPRVRGNPLPACCGEWRRRSIPACAGEPGRRCRKTARIWVYPRVCGGTLPARRDTLRKSGLSPRVRGNRGVATGDHAHARSIPACAGEPRRTRLVHPDAGVYPRVCGGTAA